MAKFKWQRHRIEKNEVEVLHWGRRTGKTAAMVYRLETNPRAVIIAPNIRMVRDMQLRTQINYRQRIMLAREFEDAWVLHPNQAYKNVEIFIDEAGIVPESFTKWIMERKQLAGISFTTSNSTVERIAKSSKRYSHKHSSNRLISEVEDRWDEATLTDLTPRRLQ